METPHQFTTIGCVLGLAWASAVQASAPPTQKPTPKPGTLAALASSTKLSRGQGSAHTGVIVITDDNLTDLGQGAALTVMTSTIAETGSIDVIEVDRKTREKWRRRVLAQSSVIAQLEEGRDRVRIEIDRLERGRLDGRALDRIAKAETKLKAVEAEIKSAKAQLSRIVRDARKEGAQPGWFR